MEDQNKSNIMLPEKITIGDIAKELGVSKSTVSRAISGKGRIGKETIQRVIECIEKYNYKPNTMAKGLANSKTYNIGVALPSDSDVRDMPFFQVCLLGVCESAAVMDYDVLVTSVKEADIKLLKNLVEHRKVDGVIIARNMTNDIALSYLKQTGFPFVLVGSSEDKDIIQIDNNHMEACEKLVSLLLSDNMRGIALLSGDRKHMVNQYRCQGYYNALKNNGITVEKDLVFYDCNSTVFIERAVQYIIKRDVKCIVCTDDLICRRVLNALREEGCSVPEDIKVASFYDSEYLKSNDPPITAIGFNAEELGIAAGKRLINLINGDLQTPKIILDYEINLRRSTK